MAKLNDTYDDQPVAVQDIYQALVHVASQDPSQLKMGEERLKQFEQHLGAWDTIHQVACEKQVHLSVRQMAVLQFKNGAIPRWRSKRLLSDEHRVSIRERCLRMLLEESDSLLANTNALILAKIARSEYPTTWPTLLSDIARPLQQHLELVIASPLNAEMSLGTAHRAARAAAQIVKELGSMKMLTGVKAMQELIERWRVFLGECFTVLWTSMKAEIESNDNPTTKITEEMRTLHELFKALSRMHFWMWSRADKPDHSMMNPIIIDFFNAFTDHWGYVLNMRQLFIASHATGFSENEKCFLDLVTKHILSIAKCFRNWQRISAIRFAQIPTCADFLHDYWGRIEEASTKDSALIEDSRLAVYPMRHLVLGLAIFKDTVAQWSPRKAKTVSNTLSSSFIEKVYNIIISRFLLLKSEDLRRWLTEPETWANDEEKEEAWEFDLKACSERVLISLTQQYSDTMYPLLAASFSKAKDMPITSLSDILQKEALYHALGCCAPLIQEQVDFKDWITEYILPEIRQEAPDTRILKRRIAWLIGIWISSSQMNGADREVWTALCSLLQDQGPSSDHVVRLAAIVAVKLCVDSIDVDLQHSLAPFLGALTQSILAMVGECDTSESTRRVLQTLSLVIERSGVQIIPYSAEILSKLPEFWTNASEDGDFLSNALILNIVEHLIKSSRGQVRDLNTAAVPLVQEALSEKNRVQLETDALALWLTVLRHSETLSEESLGVASTPLGLLPIAISLLANDLDVLGSTLAVVEGYCLLNCMLVLKLVANDLFVAFQRSFTLAASINAKDILMLLNLIIGLTPVYSWMDQFLTSGLFTTLLKNIVDDKLPTVLLTEHILLFARMSLVDPAAFVQMITVAAAAQNISIDILLNDLLDQWWIKFDNMSEPRSRKLTAMGIASLVSTSHPVVLKRLASEICNIWIDCFGEIKESEVDEQRPGSPLTLHWQHNDAYVASFVGESAGTSEETRKRQYHERDPVTSQKLTTFVASALAQAEAASGGPQQFHNMYLREADPIVIEQLQDNLKSTG